MAPTVIDSLELKPFYNHIYELKKGVRRMVLHTMSKRLEVFAVNRLENQNIDYFIQPISEKKVNIFFGKKECVEMVCKMIDRPLNQLTAEEDFILGTLLGYDLSMQCERYCQRKS